MLKSIYRRIAFLGCNASNFDSISQIKIINCICAMIVLMLLVQIFFTVIFWHYGGWLVLSVNICHLFIFSFIPILNHYGHFHSARSALMLCYISLIGFSSVCWQIDLHFKYFLVIALFVGPFLYRSWETPLVYMNILAYLCSFAAIEWYWLEQGAFLMNPISTHAILPVGNDLFLLSAAILASQLIYSNSRQSHFKAKFLQQRAENILSQTLPTALVKKLTSQASEDLFSKPFENKFACVLFADMQNYTQLCSSTNNQQLMQLLTEFYSRMDEISRRWGLEKIKTNGDQYVATCGLFVEHATPSLPSCQAALEMLSLTKLLSSHYAIKLGLRIGIASGDVSSGFIGGHSSRFDIWGSTVNLASRLESYGITDKVQVCQTTHHQCKHRLNFIPRGKIKLKGIGTLDAFILQPD